jgi:hydrogenase maturation protein HypF
MGLFGRDLTGKSRIALTGGVFMNRVLTDILRTLLEAEGFTVLLHRSVPPNDGGISLGQAVIAGRMK